MTIARYLRPVRCTGRLNLTVPVDSRDRERKAPHYIVRCFVPPKGEA